MLRIAMFLLALPIAAAAPSERIAVLPPDNLAGGLVPLAEIETAIREGLDARGVPQLAPAELEEFLSRHRVRYTGGVAPEVGRALGEETGATAALITSVELHDDTTDVPRFALTSRLVSTGTAPRILWMDGAAGTGDERPGLLSMGLVQDAGVLRHSILERLLDSLARHLAGGEPPRPSRAERRFRSQRVYRADVRAADPEAALRIAVLPFTNASARRRAGDLMALHLVRSLAGREGVVVVEPGIVREVLLQTRLIPQGGITWSQAELLNTTLDADLVLTGTVMDYQDVRAAADAPVVDFMVQGFDPAGHRLAWSSMAHHTGSDRVFFFEKGKVRTAHGLASRMAANVVDGMLRPHPGGLP